MDLAPLRRALTTLDAPLDADAEADELPDTRQAAVAILLRPAPEELEVLLMRRAERPDDRWSGQIGLPGGHAEPADPDLLATAVRETEEEVGVDLAASARPLGRLESLQAKARGKLVPVRITPFVFERTVDVTPVTGPEADEAFWFPLHHAREGALDARHRFRRGEQEFLLPSWNHDGRVVWGLTYEILTRLIERL